MKRILTFLCFLALSARAQAEYVPGMGEIMGATQMRHAKLWFAGKSGNWPLAKYELSEIGEGLDDAVHYHPVFKGTIQVSKMLGKFTSSPLQALDAAIDSKDSGKFESAFDSLTKGCNACHRAAGHGFIVITRPAAPPYANQDFAPHGK